MLIKYCCKNCHKEKLHDPIRGIKGDLTYASLLKSSPLGKWDLSMSRREPGKVNWEPRTQCREALGMHGRNRKTLCILRGWGRERCLMYLDKMEGRPVWLKCVEWEGKRLTMRLGKGAWLRVMQGFGVHVDKCGFYSMRKESH